MDNIKDKIYMSDVYIKAFTRAFKDIYGDRETNDYQVYSFDKNEECYFIEIIEITTNQVSTFIIYKNTCDVSYISSNGQELLFEWSM